MVYLDREYRFTFLNRRAEELLAPGGTLLGVTLLEAFPATLDAQAPYLEQYRRSMELGLPAEFERYYPEPLNMWLAVKSLPAEDGIVIFFRDVSRTPILCFENDIRQVLNNLIAKAIDAMRSGGRLIVRAHDVTAHDVTAYDVTDHHVTECSGGRRGVRITVADTGHGISPDHPRAGLRALLHPQGAERHRPGTVDLLRDRQAPSWPADRAQLPGSGPPGLGPLPPSAPPARLKLRNRAATGTRRYTEGNGLCPRQLRLVHLQPGAIYG